MNKKQHTYAIIAVTIMAIIVCSLYVLPAMDGISDGIPDRIIEVPESYGAIVSISRRPFGLTIAFESGDILFLRVSPNRQPHIKVMWIEEGS